MITRTRLLPFHAGCSLHIPMGVKHTVSAKRGDAIVSIGGFYPTDVRLLKVVVALPPNAESSQ